MNKKFVIVSDSCCELSEEMRKQYDVDYIPMRVSYDDKDLPADVDWKVISAKEFYDVLRGDTRIFTAQVPFIEYKEKFEEYIKNGYDILSISCSSALSILQIQLPESCFGICPGQDRLLQTDRVGWERL